jgi:hypothetical protein
MAWRCLRVAVLFAATACAQLGAGERPTEWAASSPPVTATPRVDRVSTSSDSAATDEATTNGATTGELGPLAGQYLVRTSGAIVLRGHKSQASRVLVPRVRGALYDPALELLWFIDDDLLRVLDLRDLPSAPITIASNVPWRVSRLSIEHPSNLAETEDGCDLDALSLEWTPTPKAYVADPNAPQPRIENRAWMEAQRTRPPRATGKRLEFEDARVKLPRALMHCEEPERCGAMVPFGALQLVMTAEKMGGDCMHRGCLLLDSATGRFAQPAEVAAWHTLKGAPVGTCGLFMFNRAGTTFLVGNKLCGTGEACRELEGHALGWMVPGDIVGAPGLP